MRHNMKFNMGYSPFVYTEFSSDFRFNKSCVKFQQTDFLIL